MDRLGSRCRGWCRHDRLRDADAPAGIGPGGTAGAGRGVAARPGSVGPGQRRRRVLLDCRAADTGCTKSAATASWGGRIHLLVGILSFLAMAAAPFAFSLRFRLLDSWRDKAALAMGFGSAMLILVMVYVATGGRGGHGLPQRGIALCWPRRGRPTCVQGLPLGRGGRNRLIHSRELIFDQCWGHRTWSRGPRQEAEASTGVARCQAAICY
jgi:hypothetical protein